jgi:hypothetical protein
MAIVVGLLTGCGSNERTTAAASPTPATARPVSPIASPPPVSPSPPSCEKNRSWKDEEKAQWVETHSESNVPVTAGYDDAAGVTFLKIALGPTLCTPITVRMDYWKVTYPSSAKGKWDTVELKPAGQVRVSVDGRRERQLPMPKAVRDRGTCRRAAVLRRVNSQIPCDVTPRGGN